MKKKKEKKKQRIFWSLGDQSHWGQTKKKEEFKEITDFLSPQAFKFSMILRPEPFV